MVAHGFRTKAGLNFGSAEKGDEHTIFCDVFRVLRTNHLSMKFERRYSCRCSRFFARSDIKRGKGSTTSTLTYACTVENDRIGRGKGLGKHKTSSFN